ncbi:MAG: hypothetical protein C4326_01325 [Ignavibacteria bacterium]
MPLVTIILGALLVLAGFIGFLAADSVSPTALIPAAFGFMMIALGILARNESLRKHAMHGAAAVGLLGFFGSVSGLWQLIEILRGAESEPTAAMISRSFMAVVCLVFVAVTVRSFIAARSKANPSARANGD